MPINNSIKRGISDPRFKASGFAIRWNLLLIFCLCTFTQCTTSKSVLRFGMSYNNFEEESLVTLDFDGCPVYESNIVFSDNYNWIEQTKGKPLADTLTNAILELDMLLYLGKEEQRCTKLSTSNGTRDEMTLLGKMDLSKEYESYLLLVEKSSQWTNCKELYLMNTKGNRLISMVEISQYTAVDANSFYIYTIDKGKNKYTQRCKTLNSDSIDLSVHRNEIDQGQSFTIQKNGTLRVL